MKKTVKIFLKFLLLIVFLAGLLFITSKIFEEKIVQKAVSVINNQLDVPIYVESLQFSLLRKFPDATLLLNDVSLLSSKNFNKSDFDASYADTLVYFKELYLAVNVWALLKNKLDITKAYAQKGYVNFLVDKNGKENFKVFSINPIRSSTNSTAKDLVFMLNQIQLKKVELRFINKFKKTSISIYAPNYSVKGQFYKNNYTASSQGKLLLNYFEQGKIKIQPSRPASIQMNLKVTNNLIEIINGSIQTNSFNLSTTGKVFLDSTIKLDLKISGTSNNLDALLQTIDLSSDNKIKTQGNLGISAVVRGIIDNKHTPAIAANFKLLNGQLSHKNSGLVFNSVQFDGTYTNGNQQNLTTTKVELSNVQIMLDSSAIAGGLSIVNFDNPYFTASAQTLIHLNEFDVLVKNKNDYYFDGIVIGKFRMHGRYTGEAVSWLDNIYTINKSGEFSIENGFFKMKDPSIQIRDFASSIKIVNNTLSLNDAKGNFQGTNFTASVSTENYLMPIIDSLYPVNMNATLWADNISYTDFEHLFKNTGSTSEREYNLKSDFSFEKIKYKKLLAEKASGKLSYIHKQLNIKKIEFDMLEGSVFGDINYLSKINKSYLFQTHATTKNVNINTLFNTFNNFNQNFISEKNIKGYLTSDFDLEFLVKNDKVDTSSLELLGHIRIDEGKLIDFKPIVEASKFSEIEELKSIEFSKLENDILISNSTINIPKMEIISNAFDIKLFGSQKFNGDYQYHLQLNMADFMGGKSKRLAKQQTNFGYIADDGFGKRTLFLIATSKKGKSTVKLDKSEIKKNLKNDLIKGTKQFKKALHDEFGWFKKDTTLNSIQKTDKEPEFIIEWDEE
ncbi:MAG: hypothetical protein PF517_02420 [Salinivirgaceae bacterium]|jgi:hypothetical protein|nr:hypothetical protein [Salinivirgaceae bacterium]